MIRDPREAARELLSHGSTLTADQIRVRQAAIGVPVDGVIGAKTRAAARATLAPIGPVARVLPISHAERCRRFGRFDFKAAPSAGNPERILILAGWAEKNIAEFYCPQLVRFGRPYVNLHHKAADGFLALWRAWDAAGLTDLIESWNGSWVPRFKRGMAGGGMASLSNHSWGTAFDINARVWPLGKTVPDAAPFRQLVPIANAHGWFWGGDFRTRPDGMHFEFVGK